MSIIAAATRASKEIFDQATNVILEPFVRRQLEASRAGAPERFDCVIYFADEPSSAYQVNQWFGPMLELSKLYPTAILVRRSSTAAVLARESPLPVFLTRSIDQVETFVNINGIRLIFYVNNNRDNFTALRQSGPVHVHLSHGESDKISMASNQLKAYDYAFIAGPASRRRILTNVRRFDATKLREIGRPQLDTAASAVENHDDARLTVLYAPTWEGDRPAMAYGSLVSHGVPLVKALLADSRYRLIFRPHPRSGVRNAEHRKAVEEISQLIERAVTKDPDAGHYRDRRPDFSAAMAEADVCICDISAMAMDWLPRRKPLLVTRPAIAAAHVDSDGFTRGLSLLDADQAENIPAILDGISREPISAAQLELIADHFGDITPGASTQRFLDAVSDALS